MGSLKTIFSSATTTSASTSTWLALVTAIWVQSISGNNYAFSNYSEALKAILNLTQLELNNLSVAKDFGKALGLLAGFASDRLPTPVILLIGALEGFIGYGAQYLVVSRRIQPLPYWQMCIFLCFGGNSTTWMNTAVLVTCLRNFRKNRGPVSGILKGYLGLSAAIFTVLCTALFGDNPATLLLMLAVIPFAVCLIAIFFLREISPLDGSDSEEKDESKYFSFFNVVAIAFALYLLAYSSIPGISGDGSFSLVYAIILLVLLALPAVAPFYSFTKHWRLIKLKNQDDVEGHVEEPLLDDREVVMVDGVEENVVGAAEVKRKPVIGEEHTIAEALCTVDFWTLFVSFLCGVGTGMTVMNNMGQIGLALGYADVSVFVSLISICGFFGRLLSGSISEYFIKKAGTPRPIWNAASQILTSVGYILMALAIPGSLYIGSVVVGVSYGARTTLVVSTASELFGLKYYGLIYNILFLNLSLGSFLFSSLAGFLYDAEATPKPGGGNTCVGAHCYKLIFLIMAAACIVGFGLDVLLKLRTKHVYTKILDSQEVGETNFDSGKK